MIEWKHHEKGVNTTVLLHLGLKSAGLAGFDLVEVRKIGSY